MGSGAGAAVRFHNIYSGNYPPFQATALQRESDYGMERSAGTEAGPWVGLLSSPSLHALCSELWDAGIPPLSFCRTPNAAPWSFSVHCAAPGDPKSPKPHKWDPVGLWLHRSARKRSSGGRCPSRGWEWERVRGWHWGKGTPPEPPTDGVTWTRTCCLHSGCHRGGGICSCWAAAEGN